MCLQTLLSISKLINNIIHTKRIRFGEAKQDLLLISILKHVLFLFFYGVKGRRRRMKTKTDLKSPRLGDIVGNSTQLNAA